MPLTDRLCSQSRGRLSFEHAPMIERQSSDRMTTRADFPIAFAISRHEVVEEFYRFDDPRIRKLVARKRIDKQFQYMASCLKLAVFVPVVRAAFEPVGAKAAVAILERHDVALVLANVGLSRDIGAVDGFAPQLSVFHRKGDRHDSMCSAAGCAVNGLCHFFGKNLRDCPSLTIFAFPSRVRV